MKTTRKERVKIMNIRVKMMIIMHSPRKFLLLDTFMEALPCLQDSLKPPFFDTINPKAFSRLL